MYSAKTAVQLSALIVQDAQNFTADDLAMIRRAMNYAAEQLQNRVKYSVRVGTVVKWDSRTAGGFMTGKVTRMGSKNLYVTTDRGNWKVSAQLCTVV